MNPNQENSNWISYPKAKEALDILHDLKNFHKTNRMPNLLIYGETNNGKTELLKHFCQLNPPQLNPLIDNIKHPVVYTECCVSPDESRIYNFILDSLNIYHKQYSSIDQRKSKAIGALKAVQCELLIIDEIQHILTSSALKQRTSMTTIKSLSNTLKIPVVLVGTQDALRVVHTDNQLKNRFPAFELPIWKKNNEYVQLLASLVKNFAKEGVEYTISKEFAIAVHEKSEGVLGMTSKIIERCIKQNPKELRPTLITNDILYRP